MGGKKKRGIYLGRACSSSSFSKLLAGERKRKQGEGNNRSIPWPKEKNKKISKVSMAKSGSLLEWTTSPNPYRRGARKGVHVFLEWRENTSSHRSSGLDQEALVRSRRGIGKERKGLKELKIPTMRLGRGQGGVEDRSK